MSKLLFLVVLKIEITKRELNSEFLFLILFFFNWFLLFKSRFTSFKKLFNKIKIFLNMTNRHKQSDICSIASWFSLFAISYFSPNTTTYILFIRYNKVSKLYEKLFFRTNFIKSFNFVSFTSVFSKFLN